MIFRTIDESIGSIQANTLITLVRSKKDGIDTYYQMDEYNGYIKKKSVKIIRDEEFFYASALLQKKQNRSKYNRFNQMKLSVAADTNTPSTRPSSSTKAPSTNTANNGANNKADNGDGLVKQYNKSTVDNAQAKSTNKPTLGGALTAVATAAASSVLGGNRNTGALVAANKLKSSLSQTKVRAGNQTIMLTGSFGLASSSGVTTKPSDLLKMTEKALKLARKRGGNQIA